MYEVATSLKLFNTQTYLTTLVHSREVEACTKDVGEGKKTNYLNYLEERAWERSLTT